MTSGVVKMNKGHWRTATSRSRLKCLVYVGCWGELFTCAVGTGSSQSGVIQNYPEQASLAEGKLSSSRVKKGLKERQEREQVLMSMIL